MRLEGHIYGHVAFAAKAGSRGTDLALHILSLDRGWDSEANKYSRCLPQRRLYV